ncbi:MAG: ATP-binding protein [Bradymonadales bacterium]|nr:ATP-binding protein [Bradymonadales bacterium]
MRDLSLHILDLAENSVRAGASLLVVSIEEDPVQDRLTIVVEDNGSGLAVTPESATDPFYTTKKGKRVGLGLALFKGTVEQAGGRLVIDRSEHGGVAVKAEMQLRHIDRNPLGDLAATLSSVVCTNPGLDICCRLSVGEVKRVIQVSQVARQLPENARHSLAVARRVSEEINAALTELRATA